MSPDTLTKTDSRPYVAVLESNDLSPVRDWPWLRVGLPNIEHGWKLHVSSVQTEAVDSLRRVVPILRRFSVPFKVAADEDILELLNAGMFGHTQVGKFATVYSDELSESRRTALVERLVDATSGMNGPRIVTDAHLGGCIYCRYGEYRPTRSRNRLGVYEAPEMDRELTAYSVPFEMPDGVDGAEVYGVEEASSTAPTRPIGPGYLVLDAIQTHSKGAVLLALDLRDRDHAEKVVLKEGRAWCMSDAEGRDMRDRLRHQAEVYDDVGAQVQTPEIAPVFEHQGNCYLPIEHVEGRDLDEWDMLPYRERTEADRRRLLEDLSAAAKAIRNLHRAGYLHRDLSPTNLRVTEDGVYLLDLELAHRRGSERSPFMEGTPGFVSPQQRKGRVPKRADDVYSFGAVCGSLLTGVKGSNLPAGADELSERLERLSGAPRITCETVAACLSEERASRPTMQEVDEALDPALASETIPSSFERDRILDCVRSGVDWLLAGARVDPNTGMWRSPVLEGAHQSQDVVVEEETVYRSANRGVAGVVYLLSRLQGAGLVVDPRIPDRVESAVDWLLAHHDTPDDQMPGLHFGEAGVAVAICESIAAGILDRGAWLDRYLEEVFTVEPDWPDLTHGAAGQGLAVYICGDLLESTDVVHRAAPFADYLIERQEEFGAWRLPEGVRAMEGECFTGFAHGAAGILYFLAKHARQHDSDLAEEAALAAVDWLMDTGRVSSSGVSLWWPMSLSTEPPWHWWCHGAPGIALGFLAAYEMTGERRYAGAARACLRTHPVHVRYPNLSQCHGLSGLGEIYLEAYRVLGDDEWLTRARRLAQVLADLAQPTSRGSAWNVENPLSYPPDLMTGSAGVLHFLARTVLHEREGRTAFSMPLLTHTAG